MSLFTLEDVLDPEFFMYAYNEVDATTKPNAFYDFYMGTPEQQDGRLVEMVYYPTDKQVVSGNAPGSPSKPVDLKGASKKYFASLRSFNHIDIDMQSVTYLRQDSTNAIQDKGQQEIQRQLKLFSAKHRKFKEVVFSKMMTTGVCYFNSDWMPLESNSGADTSKTLDWGVPANNKNQLNSIIGTRWDQAAAPILDDLVSIRLVAEENNTETPRHIWTNSTARQWILSNTELKSFMVLNSPRAEAVLNGIGDQIVFDNFTWHFFDGTYIGADGSTTRKFIADKVAVITPDPGDWLFHVVTPELVPSATGVVGSAEEGVGKFDKVYGDFMYAKVIDDPARLRIHGGFNWFTGLKNPYSIFCAVAGT